MSGYILNEPAENGPMIVGSFRVWILFFVGDPFTVERTLEKLRAMPDRAEARKILQKLKRDKMFCDEFRGTKL
jgi:hypothetical protein